MLSPGSRFERSWALRSRSPGSVDPVRVLSLPRASINLTRSDVKRPKHPRRGSTRKAVAVPVSGLVTVLARAPASRETEPVDPRCYRGGKSEATLNSADGRATASRALVRFPSPVSPSRTGGRETAERHDTTYALANRARSARSERNRRTDGRAGERTHARARSRRPTARRRTYRFLNLTYSCIKSFWGSYVVTRLVYPHPEPQP